MIGKVILFILSLLFIIPGVGSLISGLATPSQYENVASSRIGYGIVFLGIGIFLFRYAQKLNTDSKL
jgi:hypothetical protein